MDGSQYPTAADVWRIVNEGTTPFDANLLNELAAALTATQIVIGPNAADQSEVGGAGAQFPDIATLLQSAVRIEIGSYSHAAGTTSQTVNFAASRFTSAPLVFLVPEYAAGMGADWQYIFYADAVTSTNFIARRWFGSTTAQTTSVSYFAIQLA